MIETVLSILRDNGYEVRPTPLHIADHRFACDAALEGPDGSSELVLVVTRQQLQLDDIQRRLRALTLALDGTDSIRPLTVILIGPTPSVSQLSTLLRVCRVIPIPGGADDETIRAALAPLLSLDLPGGAEHSRATRELLAERLGSLRDDPYVSPLIEAAEHGAEAVEACFLEILSQIVADRAQKVGDND